MSYSKAIKNRVIFLHFRRYISIAKICEIIGVGKSTVYNWISSYQAKFTNQKKVDYEKIHKQHLQGYTVKEISLLNNIPLSTIYHSLSRSTEKPNANNQGSLKKENKILKISLTVLEEKLLLKSRPNHEKALLVQMLSSQYSKSLLFPLIGIPKSSFYYHIKEIPSNSQVRRDQFTKEIIRLFHFHKKALGPCSIHKILQSAGNRVSLEFVRSVFKKNNMKSPHQKLKKKFVIPTDRNSNTYQNHILKEFRPLCPNRVWAGDITSFSSDNSVFHLSIVMDLFSRRILSARIHERNNSKLSQQTLLDALKTRKTNPIIFHSDRGPQYTNLMLEAILKENHISHSYSAIGYPYDNAPVESFFHLLKTECFFSDEPKQTPSEMKSAILQYIEYYNQLRPHSFNHYQSPIQAEVEFGKKAYNPNPFLPVLTSKYY